MFICQYDANAPGVPVNNIDILFQIYAVQNIHTTVAAAWGARFDIPIPAGGNMRNGVILGDDKDEVLTGDQYAMATILNSCGMLMAYNAVDTYVCHISSWGQDSMKQALAGRLGNRLLLITPSLCVPGENTVDDFWCEVVNNLMLQGHNPKDICLIDGKRLLQNAYMCANGSFKPVFV